MTLDEVADAISKNLPPWQRNANLAFLRYAHSILTLGGIWGWPGLLQVWQKTEEGFELRADLSKDMLRVGDTVAWRDGWGADEPRDAIVQEITLTSRGNPEDGESVPAVPWAFVNMMEPRKIAVLLNSGKWAYGAQISKKPV